MVFTVFSSSLAFFCSLLVYYNKQTLLILQICVNFTIIQRGRPPKAAKVAVEDEEDEGGDHDQLEFRATGAVRRKGGAGKVHLRIHTSML